MAPPLHYICGVKKQEEKMKTVLISFLAICAIGILAMSKNGPQLTKSEDVNENTIKDVAGRTLNISNRNGSIYISGWDKDFIQYVFTKSTNYGLDELSKVTVEIDKNQKSIDISVKPKNNMVRVSVKMDLRVPMNLLLGSITTTNGSIELSQSLGNTTLNTSNGKIIATDHRGSISAHSSNGRIELTNVSNSVTAKTSNGKIILSNIPAITMARTSNGSIYAEVMQMKEDAVFASSNGSITLVVNEDINAEIDAHTSNSKIVIDGLDVRVETLSRSTFKGRIGRGGPTLSARTSNGKIKMEALPHTGELF